MFSASSRDGWDWVDLFIRILSGIAVPAVIGYFGMQLNAEQQRNLKTEQVRSTIEHLTSESWRERFLGVKVMQHYQDQDEGYPAELISAIVGILNTEEHPTVRREAAKRFSEVEFEQDETPADVPRQVASRAAGDVQQLQRQVRFYIHIGAEEQRSRAQAVQDSLNNRRFGSDKPIHVPGVERLDNLPSNTELRYFNPDQAKLAGAMEQYLEAAFDMEVELRDLTQQLGRIPDHFELWMPPN